MGRLRNFGTAAAFVLSAPIAGAQQQPIVLNFDDLACTSTPLSTYQSWISLVDGTTCSNNSSSWTRPESGTNYITQTSGNVLGWSFLNGPVTLDGMWASGLGSYFMELLNGGQVLYAYYFGAFIGPTWVAANYPLNIDQVRISWGAGTPGVGVDDITFRPVDPNAYGAPNQSNPDPPSSPYSTGGGSSGDDGSTGSGGSTGPSGYTPPSGPGGDGGLDPISEPSVTPEPATLLLVATGLGGIGAVARRQRRKREA